MSLATPADGFLAVQRRVAALLPAAISPAGDAPLEFATLGAVDPPRLITADVLEGRTIRVVDVTRAAEPRFAAFLDGTQTSRVVAHVDAAPIVHGTVAAVVRARVERRMRTWRTRIERRLYVPFGELPPAIAAALRDSGVPVVDTLEGRTLESRHPFALQDAAIHAVQEDREVLERELGDHWCGEGGAELLVDGSIAGSERMATSACAIGVVKSHRTLYVEGKALQAVLHLRAGQRSSVFRVTSPKRTPVASWYLRLRDNAGRDPLWGLVRVEVADAMAGRALRRRADEVSGWVLAEALPLAVPDARWDKMVYGIRDCEEFLKAIQ